MYEIILKEISLRLLNVLPHNLVNATLKNVLLIEKVYHNLNFDDQVKRLLTILKRKLMTWLNS